MRVVLLVRRSRLRFLRHHLAGREAPGRRAHSSAFPKPSTNPQCSKRLEYADACLKDDFDACYFAGTCVLADALGQPEATQKKLAHDAAPFFKTACTAGMAEACRMRVGKLQSPGNHASALWAPRQGANENVPPPSLSAKRVVNVTSPVAPR